MPADQVRGPVPSAPAELRFTVPPARVKPPEKVLAPERVSVPAPDFVRPALPDSRRLAEMTAVPVALLTA